ncbi:O-antigen ligase family protein [Paucibacter sp. R3-3]|uniref:O-antigen ligase family protein n=1 Tax=Roseateles agri TaxID=3098619 RepID=A0ABU5DDZ0_9BURK|nr:O-antigen ligase family protein [Paucibacter sp. R3-3]MDY0744499.1 O-antigen ligase family protein [Paucibacter sp. R3-3]
MPAFKYRHVALWVTLVVVTGLTPLMPAHWLGNWHDFARVMECWTFVLSVPVFSKFLVDGGQAVRRLVCASLCWALLLCARAPVAAMALREVLTLFGLLMLVLAVGAAWRLVDYRWILARGLSGAAGAYAAVALTIVLAAKMSDVPLDNGSIFFGYDNPRFLNHAQVVFIPLLAGISLSTLVSQRWRLLVRATLAIQFALLYFSVGRSAGLALSISAVAALAFGRMGRRLAIEITGCAAVGAMVYLALFGTSLSAGDHVVDTLHASADLTSDHSRLYLWRIAVEDVRSAPVLGIGPMHFAHYLNRSGAHPHNFCLQVMAEFGLPFALIVLGALATALVRRLRRMHKEIAGAEHIELAAVMACVAIVCDGISSGNFVMPISQMWIAIAAGIASAGSPSKQFVSQAVWPRAFFTGVLFAIYVAFAMNTTWVWSERRVVAAFAGEQVGMADHAPLRPRFWLDGWF